MNRLGILIIGYKNVAGIARLLESLNRVDFNGDKDITLIFSIDYSGDKSVQQLASKYTWEHGRKIIKAHEKNLGLKKHILSCGNYLNEYGLDAMAVLEDDIYVAPEMYNYMKAAVEFYKDSEQIAGISLYKHEINLNAKHPFDEFKDGGDTFFIQYAMSWGQIWLRNQWNSFYKWYKEGKADFMDKDKLPKNLLKWKNSWLKYHIMYCIDTDKYFVYPRIALTTDFSDIGAHNMSRTTSMQIAFSTKKKGEWIFNKLDETKAIYDSFFENIKIKEYLKIPDVIVDLYGVKKYDKNTRYVITRRELPYKVLKSWGLFLRPIEANIFYDIEGEEIRLYDLSIAMPQKKRNIFRKYYFEYDLKGVNILSIDNIIYCLSKLKEAVIYKSRLYFKNK